MSWITLYITQKRNLKEEPQIKIGLDGGEDFLKVCLNLYTSVPYAGRFSDRGVKKLYIIGIPYKVDEIYENIKLMLSLAFKSYIDAFNFTVAIDLKQFAT